jgi:hypothetical protein
MCDLVSLVTCNGNQTRVPKKKKAVMDRSLAKNTVLGLSVPVDFFLEFAGVIREGVCHFL